MTNEIIPRRSVLYAPGANLRALDKARQLPIDCLIMDLEDAVAPDAKPPAREQIVTTLAEGGFGRRELVVRVNGLDTPWGHDDVVSIARSGAHGVVFPKVESPEHVIQAIKALDAAGAPANLPIWIMVETPRGVLDVDRIAAAHPRVSVIVIGTTDLAKSMRVPHTPSREGLFTALGLCILAARAHELDILDGVYLDLKDHEGYRKSCQQGRDLGFDGKTLIHPNQIEHANEYFGVSDEAMMRACSIIAAWEEAEAAGKGVCVVDGRLVEHLHVDEARRTIAVYQAIS